MWTRDANTGMVKNVQRTVYVNPKGERRFKRVNRSSGKISCQSNTRSVTCTFRVSAGPHQVRCVDRHLPQAFQAGLCRYVWLHRVSPQVRELPKGAPVLRPPPPEAASDCPCAICLADRIDFVDDAPVMDCGHVFCRGCLADWVGDKGGYKKRFPMCRACLRDALRV